MCGDATAGRPATGPLAFSPVGTLLGEIGFDVSHPNRADSPSASTGRAVGSLEALKIAVAKPPEDHAANVATEKFLASRLGLRRSQVALVSGFTSRDKVVRISGLSRERLRALARGHRGGSSTLMSVAEW